MAHGPKPHQELDGGGQLVAALRLLVSSCDDYSDCWTPFFHGLRTYWPDCPYPVTLLANFRTTTDNGTPTLALGEDRGWSSNLIQALDGVTEPYILYAQEDYWLDKPVEQAAIEGYLAFMEQDGADYVRLIPLPPPDGQPACDGRLASITPSAPYRTALQMALWRTDALRRLLEPGQTGWEFETDGRDGQLTAYCVRPQPSASGLGIHYVLAITRGKWCRAALEYARKEGLRLDLSRRATEKRSDILLSQSQAGRLLVHLYRRAKRVVGAGSDPSTSLIRS